MTIAVTQGPKRAAELRLALRYCSSPKFLGPRFRPEGFTILLPGDSRLRTWFLVLILRLIRDPTPATVRNVKRRS